MVHRGPVPDRACSVSSSSIGTLLAFVIVSAGILVLRYRSPDLHRPFRTPIVPVVPILAILICGYMMYGLPTDTWYRLHHLARDRPRDLLRLRQGRTRASAVLTRRGTGAVATDVSAGGALSTARRDGLS